MNRLRGEGGGANTEKDKQTDVHKGLTTKNFHFKNFYLLKFANKCRYHVKRETMTIIEEEEKFVCKAQKKHFTAYNRVNFGEVAIW